MNENIYNFNIYDGAPKMFNFNKTTVTFFSVLFTFYETLDRSLVFYQQLIIFAVNYLPLIVQFSVIFLLLFFLFSLRIKFQFIYLFKKLKIKNL
jgi:hypothetical protein